MSDDLIDRLQNPHFDDLQWPKGLFAECADRIESLETALREICDGPRDVEKSYAELFAEVCTEARAALKGEKKDERN